MVEKIAIVNSADEIIGFDEKLRVHRDGILHRAFSALLVNEKGELLIQRRAEEKYHSGGLLSNSFCSHFREGESVSEALNRAANDELNISIDDYSELGSFEYHVKLGELSENEIDHVYLVHSSDLVKPNPSEVSQIIWVDIPTCIKDVKHNKAAYTYWFNEIMNNAKIAAMLSEVTTNE